MNTQSVTAGSSSSSRGHGNSIAAFGLFVLGVCATLYVPLVVTESLIIRPVQLAPLVIGLFTLLFAGGGKSGIDSRFYLAPILWAVYMVARHGPAGPEGVLEAIRSVTNVIACLTVLRLCRSAGSERFLAIGLIAGCLISLAASAARINFGEVRTIMGSNRWQGFMPGANRLGNLCGICLFLGVLELLSHRTCRSLSRTICFAFVVSVCALGILMSGSRGALLAGVLTCGIVLVIGKFATGQLMTSFRILSAGLVLFFGVQAGLRLFCDHLPARITALLENRDEAFSAAHNDPRRELFILAWECFLDSPWLGAGAKAKFFSLGRHDTSAHNAYLYLLSTSGAVGLALFFYVPGTLSFRLLRIIRRCPSSVRGELGRALGSLALLTFIAVHAMVIETAQSVHTWLMFGLVGYFCSNIERQLLAARVFATSHSKSMYPWRKAA